MLTDREAAPGTLPGYTGGVEGGRDTGVLRGLSLYTLVPVPRVVTWNPTVTIPSPWIYPHTYTPW